MKNILIGTLVLFFCHQAQAQTRLEAFVMPGIGYRHMVSSSEDFSADRDSMNQMDHARQNWGGGLKIILSLDKFSDIQLGIGYKSLSFTRIRQDLQFHDTVHPEIGRLLDLSQTVLQKDAYFYHRYRYISFPIAYQKAISRGSVNDKARFYFAAGLDFDLLFSDKTKVALRGFSVGGEDRFVISNDYDASAFNVGLNLGGRFEYRLDGTSNLSVQPAFYYPILTSAKDEMVSFRLFQASVAVGVNRYF